MNVFLLVLTLVMGVYGGLPAIAMQSTTSVAAFEPQATLVVANATSTSRFICGGAVVVAGTKTGLVLTALNVSESFVWASAGNVTGSVPNAVDSVTVFGLALLDPLGEYDLVYIVNRSCSTASHPTCVAALPSAFTLVGGGGIDLGGAGASVARNVLTESRPTDDLRGWQVSGKDHLVASVASVVAVSVGIRRRDGRPLTFAVRVARTRTTRVVSWPDATAAVEAGGVLLCGGARTVYGGAGQLLVASAPSARGWTVQSKDSQVADASVVDAYALYAVPLGAAAPPPPPPILTCFADGTCVDLSAYDATAADRAAFAALCASNADWVPFCTAHNVAMIARSFSGPTADLFGVFAYTAGSFVAQNDFLRSTNGAPLPVTAKTVQLLTASGLRVLAANTTLVQPSVVYRGEPDYDGAPCLYGDGTPAFETLSTREVTFGWTSTSASSNYSLEWPFFRNSPRLRVHMRRPGIGSFLGAATCAEWQVEVTLPPGARIKYLGCERVVLPTWNGTAVPVAVLYEYDATAGDATPAQEASMLARLRTAFATPQCFPVWCSTACRRAHRAQPCSCPGPPGPDPSQPVVGVCT